jgi:hypothetical protein
VQHEVGWVSASDGFLVLDRNGDGQINSGRELFGQGYGAGRRQHRQGPATRHWPCWIANHDGVIDVNDAEFAKLQVWQDVNQDGVTQAGELQDLNTLGIVSLRSGCAADLGASGWQLDRPGLQASPRPTA